MRSVKRWVPSELDPMSHEVYVHASHYDNLTAKNERLKAELAEAREVLKCVRAILPQELWTDDTRRMLYASIKECG